MQYAASPKPIRQAGALLQHWVRDDLPAVVECIAEIGTLEEAHDVIAALLIMRQIPDNKLPWVTAQAACAENILRRAECVARTGCVPGNGNRVVFRP